MTSSSCRPNARQRTPCTLLALDEVADKHRGGWYQRHYGILAASPTVFCDVGDIAPVTPSEFAVRIGRPRDLLPAPLHCVFTPQGARVELVTVPLPPETSRLLVNERAVCCTRGGEAMARSPFRCLVPLRCTDRHGHLIALPLCCPEEDVAAAENIAIGIHATCVKHWYMSPRVVRLSAAASNNLDVVPTCVEVSVLRHWQEPVEPKACRHCFSKSERDSPLWLWQHGGKAPLIQLAANCEEELRSVGFTLTPLAVESHQSEGPRPAEINLTTALNTNLMMQQPPHDNQRMSQRVH
ncbi:hypothetical protein C2E23DRAFT_254281 [Lenzites betulinus]|nr:hypothetical protein C2E23DRAFT_254281 [Lenzites betulinus]